VSVAFSEVEVMEDIYQLAEILEKNKTHRIFKNGYGKPISYSNRLKPPPNR
jgi:hypothetical protein